MEILYLVLAKSRKVMKIDPLESVGTMYEGDMADTTFCELHISITAVTGTNELGQYKIYFRSHSFGSSFNRLQLQSNA